MTQTQQDKIEQADKKLNEYPLTKFVLGYVINESNEVEYLGVACVNDEQVKRNQEKCLNSVVFDLIKK